MNDDGRGDDRALRERPPSSGNQDHEKLTVANLTRFRASTGAARDGRSSGRQTRGEARRAVGKLSGGSAATFGRCALVNVPRCCSSMSTRRGSNPFAPPAGDLFDDFRARGGTSMLTTHYMDERSGCATRGRSSTTQGIALAPRPSWIAMLGADHVSSSRSRDAHFAPSRRVGVTPPPRRAVRVTSRSRTSASGDARRVVAPRSACAGSPPTHSRGSVRAHWKITARPERLAPPATRLAAHVDAPRRVLREPEAWVWCSCPVLMRWRSDRLQTKAESRRGSP